jgi:hypothetical protein
MVDVICIHGVNIIFSDLPHLLDLVGRELRSSDEKTILIIIIIILLLSRFLAVVCLIHSSHSYIRNQHLPLSVYRICWSGQKKKKRKEDFDDSFSVMFRNLYPVHRTTNSLCKIVGSITSV